MALKTASGPQHRVSTSRTTSGQRLPSHAHRLATGALLGAALVALVSPTASADHKRRLSASLTLTQANNPPRTVTADGSRSQAGRSSISSFRFDFGDGSPPVTTTAPA